MIKNAVISEIKSISCPNTIGNDKKELVLDLLKKFMISKTEWDSVV